jgi:hypothetical protein
MSDTDQFMQTEFLSFYQRTMAGFEKNHAVLFATYMHLVPKKLRFGMRVTDNDTRLGDYTFELADGKISHVETGVLDSTVHTPFGTAKPYYIIEKSALERMVQDEQAFIDHPFATKFKYLPEITIKFLK